MKMNCMECRYHNEVVNLRKTVSRYESGEEYQKIEEKYEKEVKALRYNLHKTEISRDKYLEKYTTFTQKLRKAEEDLGTVRFELQEQRKEIEARDQEIARLLSVIAELEAKNQKLQGQVNRDYTNSSIPSSQKETHKKISNSREKTGRKPGGQKGHTGHRLRKAEATEKPVLIPTPEEIREDPDYYRTGKMICRQVIDLSVDVKVTDYYAEEYRRHSDGRRWHAPFPEGVTDRVNYGPGVKATAFLLNSLCNVSLDKVSEFMKELSDGKLRLSKGMINHLTQVFSEKTKDEREALFHRMQMSPTMHSDATVGRVNGKNNAVIVCTTPSEVLYFARDSKGIQGLIGTPVEDYAFTLIHDHDTTYYRYGSQHQECLAHVLRYLQDSIENEKDLTWSRKMKEFLSSVIHEVKGCDRKVSEQRQKEIEREYDKILRIAEKEYHKYPPSRYYRDGYNLYRRMMKYKENHLLFLSRPEVEYTNNLSERRLRAYKRKQKQAVSFRSKESQAAYCDALSIIKTKQSREENIYQHVKNVFS